MLSGVHEGIYRAGKADLPSMALLSCGLGNVTRGFEISSARFYRALRRRTDIDARLYSGGDYLDASKVWNVGRDSWLKWGLKFLPFVDDRQRWEASYVLEQVSFAFGLIPYTFAEQPDVFWTKDVPLAHILYEFRRLRGFNYKIIFANGGGFKPSTYQQFDYIQHLQPGAYEDAIAAGIPAEKMTILPNLVPDMVPTASAAELRKLYGFADDDWIVLCVAAWNKHHKRVDYLIEEVSRITDKRVKLVLCGQPEPESDELKALGQSLLGDRVRWITLPEDRVADLFHIADVFVLASLYEALGAVLIEAATCGVPIVSHPHAGSQFILNEEFWLRDLSRPGNLVQRLQELREMPKPESRLAALRTRCLDKFGEERVTGEFVRMVQKLVHRREEFDKVKLVDG